MQKVFRILNVIIGCLLIAVSINFVLKPNHLISYGFDGVASILYYYNGVRIELNLLLLNVITLSFASLLSRKHSEIIKHYLLPSILIPLFIYLTSFLSGAIDIEFPEIMLTIIVGGVLSGYGYSMICKEGFGAGSIFLVEEMLCKFTRFHTKIYTWAFDIIMLIVSLLLFDYKIILYSLIIIIITKYLIVKTSVGINDSKMFYVITSKEKEVKHYIMHDLKYEMTILDVKGGFSKKKNHIFLTVISSNDYYKLKEGIKLIDPDAFIAITSTYDVVNR